MHDSNEHFDQFFHRFKLFDYQQELYEIEESKMIKSQDYIDLSLKPMKRTKPNNKDDETTRTTIRRFDVAEISSHIGNDSSKTVRSKRMTKHMICASNKVPADRVSHHLS